MNFYFSQYLPFLPIVLIPLIIYLLFKKQLKISEFSSLYIFEKIIKKEKRRVKFLELLLLLVRTLLVAMILLFFLSPYFGESTFNRDLPVKTYIYLDNSSSTEQSFEKYKTELKRYLTSIDDYTNLYIRDNDQLKQFYSISGSNSYIDNLPVSLTQATTDQLLNEIDSLFKGDESINREILFFTDGNTGISDSKIEIKRYATNTNSYTYIDTMSANLNSENLSLNFKLNSGTDLVEDGKAKLNINGKMISNRGVEPFRGESDLSFVFDDYSNLSKISGYLEFESNQKSDKKYFSISKKTKIKLLLTGESGSPTLNSLEKGFKALNYGNLDIETSSYKNFQNHSINNYDIVVIGNSGKLDSYSLNMLKRAKRSQIQLLFYGKIENLASKKQFDRLISGVGKELTLEGRSIDWIDHKNPIFKDVFEYKKVVESSKVTKLVTHKSNNFQPILKVDGNNLLVKDRGRERYLITTSLNEEWSNLGTNGIIIPILDKIVKSKDLELTTISPWYYPNNTVRLSSNEIITPNNRKIPVSDGKFRFFSNMDGFYREVDGTTYSVNSYPDMRVSRYENYDDYDQSRFNKYLKKFNSSSYEIEIVIAILLLLIFEVLLSRSRR